MTISAFRAASGRASYGPPPTNRRLCRKFLRCSVSRTLDAAVPNPTAQARAGAAPRHQSARSDRDHFLVDESCRTGTVPPAIACEIQVATRWSISVGGRADLVAQRPLSTRDPITKLNARPDRSGHSAVAVSGRASASATARLRIISRIRCANCVAPEASKEAGRLNALPRRRW